MYSLLTLAAGALFASTFTGRQLLYVLPTILSHSSNTHPR